MTKEERFEYILFDIIDKLKNKQNVFLSGSAGVGKTKMTQEVVDFFKKIAAFKRKGKTVQLLAPTGVAAQLLKGETINTYLKLGICNSLEELKYSNFKITDKMKKEVKKLDLIIIDEISMVSKRKMEMIKYRLDQLKFKGSFLFVGDFFQLPPVSRDFAEEYAFTSDWWKELNIVNYCLTDVFRTSEIEFIGNLNKIRHGIIDNDLKQFLNSLIKPEPQDKTKYTYLMSRTNSVKEHNKTQIDLIDEREYTFEAEYFDYTGVDDKQIDKFVEENRFDKYLTLKVGAPVLFLRNEEEYKNGERGIIVKIYPNAGQIEVRKENGEIVNVGKVTVSKNRVIEVFENGEIKEVLDPIFSFLQYPISLGFAITMHKSQGMSISSLVIEPNNIFEKSQFYVAISRATNTEKLILLKTWKTWEKLIIVDESVKLFMKTVEEDMDKFWLNAKI